MATDEPHEVADIHSRLDEIARQIGAIQRAAGNQTADSPRQPLPAADAAPPRAEPLSLQAAIAEIAARQSTLDRPAPPPRPAPAAERTDDPDFTSLHRQLLHITSQIEALRPAQDIEHLIVHFRAELADIRKAVTEAMPAQAIAPLQREIRDLARRIDERRDNGGDAQALAGIERTLAEIRETLGKLTPAEQLTGFDQAIRALNHRLDSIVRTNGDPAAVDQLEGAIGSLRAVVANIASTETLERLGTDVHALHARIDALAQQPFAAGIAGSDTFVHLEQRIATLLERLETTNARSADLSRVESGLTEVLARLEQQRLSIAALQENAAERQDTAGHAAAAAPALMETIKRELSDIRYSQSESDRQTQDALEAVHTTLGYVVDRLAMIEDDLRHRPAPAPAVEVAPQTLPPRPELPNPAARSRFPAPPFDGQGLPFGDMPAPRDSKNHPDGPAEDSGTIGETMAASASAPRRPIDSRLPPDHPLEPGSLPADLGEAAPAGPIVPGSAPDERPAPAAGPDFIAAARRAAQAAAAAAPETQTRRLAAFAAATRKALKKNDRATVAAAAPLPAPEQETSADAAAEGGNLTRRIRALLVGTGIVVLAVGGFKIATMMIDGGGSEIELIAPISLAELEQAPEPAARIAAPVLSQPVTPSLTSPEPLYRPAPDGAAVHRAASGAEPAADLAAEATSAIPSPPPAARPAAAPPETAARRIDVPASETLPESIGDAGLRAAALRGHPAAAYQIALHYAEGKGVAASYDDAFKWYQRAADGGLVPAIFRLGTFYEKGLGVKKDLDAARTQYLLAAERGNAKAMHNLAVLYADGGGNGADYRSAAEWFRKAAAHGIADSQYNLAILYARGIGLEQNLAESYKWLALAAAQGDQDAGNKRDEIAGRLDAATLAAAKRAVQGFVAERQPDEAINVPTPAGGWDAVTATRRGSRTATAQRTAR